MQSMFDISPVQWFLLEASLLLLLVAFAAFLARVLPLRRHADRDADPLQPLEPETFSKCAVVVYSKDEAGELNELLPQILGQDYPEDFEVIVVNEGESASVSEVVGDFQIAHKNLYLTNTPDGARNLSRKKLAITLGIKATRMPVVVLTSAGCRIGSPLWLRAMMRHFSHDATTEVVLGFAAAPPYDDKAMGARARSFDFVADSAAWVSPAISGHPWRGTEHNLAYTRELFFRNKGFSRHLNLRNGDDDIFISEIANGDNTAVELSPDGLVEVPGALSPRAFRDEKARRSFTSRFIRRRPRVVGGLGFTCYFLVPLLAIAAGLVTPRNWVPWAAAGVVVALWYAVGLVWHFAVASLHGRRLFLTIPFLAFSRPIRKLRRGLRSIFSHSKRYTWE